MGLDLRLPTLTTRPHVSPLRWHAGIRARLIVLLGAWAAVSIEWLNWRALPFQTLLAAVVFWHGLRRERVLEGYAEIEGQLRTAEERYRALVETLPLATYVDRPGGVGNGVEWISSQIASITSYRPEEWRSDPLLFTKSLHPEDRERVLAEKATGEHVEHEYRLVRRDGSVVWIHDSAVTEANGVTRGFIVDVTRRREAEIELERQNEQLRALDRLKDEFVALVSHELRTPLTSIRGYVELLVEETDLDPEQQQFVETIDRNAHRLQRVVGDLLFCAQVEAGKLSLELGDVELDAVVGEAIHAARVSASRKEIDLRAKLGEVPAIRGDRARLAQVLDNLVSNAVKFTPSGGTVTVTTEAAEERVLLTVSDTGMGIPADELPNLFQRFFRTERATAAAIPGTGLGLAIAKAIVEGHGGTIGVESADGAGTTFRIAIPR